MPLPRDGLSLEDKVRVTRLMLKAGATIQELNVVRKHLSGIKGGLLAERLYPCTVFAFVISDIVGNPLNMVASGPLSPDPSTFGDALSILKKHKLENLVLDNAMKVIFDGTHSKVNETPKPGNACFRRVHHFLIGSNEDACRGALRALKEAGCTPLFLTSSLQGDARQAGAFFAAVSKDLNPARRTRAAWLGLVIGGETTVVVEGSGKGGRNQEAALAAAIGLGGIRGASVACMGTDGLDGPTDSAGAVVDGSTLDRAANLGLDPREFLTRNDSHTFFRKMGDLLVTGPTGTNVNDVWVSARSQKSASPRPL